MDKIYNLEGRNKAIVLFKFFAALLITYSHMGLMFPKFGGLVTDCFSSAQASRCFLVGMAAFSTGINAGLAASIRR